MLHQFSATILRQNLVPPLLVSLSMMENDALQLEPKTVQVLALSSMWQCKAFQKPSKHSINIKHILDGYFLAFGWLLASCFWHLAGFWLLASGSFGFWLVACGFWLLAAFFDGGYIFLGVVFVVVGCFGYWISHLHAHLAFGLWLLAFGLWLLVLASLGSWLLVLVFVGFLALVSLGFCLLAALLLNVCAVL